MKQYVIVKQYLEGCLNMINVNALSQALKTTWLRRILQKRQQVASTDKNTF